MTTTPRRFGNLKDLQEALNCKRTFASAVKKKLGVTSYKFDVERVVEQFSRLKGFKIEDVYPRASTQSPKSSKRKRTY